MSDNSINSEGSSPNNITNISLVEEMKKSYLDYAMSVIVSRALPDCRDGLKPVHRRILYSMNESGYNFNKPYRKSARIVGDVMGKYHPHGDSAIYQSMVRMAQDFSMRLELIDGQGNFGSLDGDPPAAMRYTEARLAKVAEKIVTDLEKETITFQPNYDDSTLEPSVLPAQYPNLLVNGASGIAVGMATNIAPHNLGEVIEATLHLIENPNSYIIFTKNGEQKILHGFDYVGPDLLDTLCNDLEQAKNAIFTDDTVFYFYIRGHIRNSFNTDRLKNIVKLLKLHFPNIKFILQTWKQKECKNNESWKRINECNTIISKQIIENYSRLINLNLDHEASYNLAKISRGTPRIALRLLRRIRDYAQVIKKTNFISIHLIKKALNSYQIDEKGLDSLDRQYLSFLNQNNNIPTGLDSIAAGLGDDSSMLEFVVEPYLIQIGFLTRTPRGRLLTASGKKYIDSENDNF